MDVVVWLRSLGLGKYEAAFRENEIDETVLPSLTHETLKELGVTAVAIPRHSHLRDKASLLRTRRDLCSTSRSSFPYLLRAASGPVKRRKR